MQVPVILDLKWKGNTALMMAAKGGYAMTVKVLIEAGADTTKRDIVSYNSFMYHGLTKETQYTKSICPLLISTHIKYYSKVSIQPVDVGLHAL